MQRHHGSVVAPLANATFDTWLRSPTPLTKKIPLGSPCGHASASKDALKVQLGRHHRTVIADGARSWGETEPAVRRPTATPGQGRRRSSHPERRGARGPRLPTARSLAKCGPRYFTDEILATGCSPAQRRRVDARVGRRSGSHYWQHQDDSREVRERAGGSATIVPAWHAVVWQVLPMERIHSQPYGDLHA